MVGRSRLRRVGWLQCGDTGLLDVPFGFGRTKFLSLGGASSRADGSGPGIRKDLLGIKGAALRLVNFFSHFDLMS